jgi:hypothetical protein
MMTGLAVRPGAILRPAMPIHLDISRLERTVVVVARGHITPEDIQEIYRQIAEANVRSFGKIIDMIHATSGVELEQVLPVAEALRGRPEEKRGPTALVVDPDNKRFAEIFAGATKGDRPLRLFSRLHEARRWLAQNM